MSEKKPMTSQGSGPTGADATSGVARELTGARARIPWKHAAKTWRAAVLGVKAWIQNEAVKQRGGAICSFCQHLSASVDDMTLHMLTCERHPLSRVLKVARETVEEVRGIGQDYRDDWSDFDGRTLKAQLLAATEALDALAAPRLPDAQPAAAPVNAPEPLAAEALAKPETTLEAASPAPPATPRELCGAHVASHDGRRLTCNRPAGHPPSAPGYPGHYHEWPRVSLHIRTLLVIMDRIAGGEPLASVEDDYDLPSRFLEFIASRDGVAVDSGPSAPPAVPAVPVSAIEKLAEEWDGMRQRWLKIAEDKRSAVQSDSDADTSAAVLRECARDLRSLIRGGGKP